MFDAAWGSFWANCFYFHHASVPSMRLRASLSARSKIDCMTKPTKFMVSRAVLSLLATAQFAR